MSVHRDFESPTGQRDPQKVQDPGIIIDNENALLPAGGSRPRNSLFSLAARLTPVQVAEEYGTAVLVGDSNSAS